MDEEVKQLADAIIAGADGPEPERDPPTWLNAKMIGLSASRWNRIERAMKEQPGKSGNFWHAVLRDVSRQEVREREGRPGEIRLLGNGT